MCKQYLKPLYFIFHVTNAQWNRHLYVRHYLSLGFLGGRAWINNLCPNTLLGEGDGWPCNSRETRMSGRNELRRERWASTTRWYVIKPATASAQNRSGRLGMWEWHQKDAISELLCLGPIHQREERQAIHLLALCLFLSLTFQNPIHFQSCCLYPPRQLLEKPEPRRVPSRQYAAIAGSSCQVVFLDCGVVSGGSLNLSGLVHKLSLIQTLTNLESRALCLSKLLFLQPMNRVQWVEWFEKSH